MLQKEKDRRGTWIALACVAGLLAVIVVLENTMQPTSMLFTVLKKGAVYALVACSLNLLNGFAGLFSLGQAGFMLLGAYTYAILTIPGGERDTVYYLYGGSAVNFSLPELFGGGTVGLILGVLAALVLAGIVAAAVAWLIGLPVLRLKSDYLAIATLGFAEIIRAIFQWDRLGPVTNGANALKSFPTFSSFNIENGAGEVVLRLSTFVPFLLAAVCIGTMVLLINSTYGRAFKAIREDEVAGGDGDRPVETQADGVLHQLILRGGSGGMFAMFANQAQAKTFTTAMTYEILLIVVIGGIGSLSGSCIAFVSVRGSQRVVAAVPGRGDVYRELQGAAAAERLPDGGVLGHHHGGGAVLPAWADGRPGAAGRGASAEEPAEEKGGGREMREQVLKMENVTMQFGGVVAVDNLNWRSAAERSWR